MKTPTEQQTAGRAKQEMKNKPPHPLQDAAVDERDRRRICRLAEAQKAVAGVGDSGPVSPRPAATERHALVNRQMPPVIDAGRRSAGD
jgi:hypothetical protein